MVTAPQNLFCAYLFPFSDLIANHATHDSAADSANRTASGQECAPDCAYTRTHGRVLTVCRHTAASVSAGSVKLAATATTARVLDIFICVSYNVNRRAGLKQNYGSSQNPSESVNCRFACWTSDTVNANLPVARFAGVGPRRDKS
jgi:hypothetical protein